MVAIADFQSTSPRRVFPFSEHPSIKGGDEPGDYYLAFDLLDPTGKVQSTFRNLNASLTQDCNPFATILKMDSTTAAFDPSTLRLHVRRVDETPLDANFLQAWIQDHIQDPNEELHVEQRDTHWVTVRLAE